MPQWSPKAEEVDTRSAWEKRTSGIQGMEAEAAELASDESAEAQPVPMPERRSKAAKRSEKGGSDYIHDLEALLYACIVELEYVQSVENCRSGLCASTNGKNLVERGMKLLQINDLSKEPSV